ncbi:uncharacterized protein N7483_008209 [Penicillium malachiteum]|uniref:uncharacterized protein n=1 Tax=Penicillium malachiteum TaxID=1324776 RepID=UPI0025488123|nr:uncharacterized protein N7483_008209 [Penicillium malachiteum]KAJ5720275.1 hypothetical protein N7483_008209 [Penicillium malachiteum]
MTNALIEALEHASSKSSDDEGESLSTFLASLGTSIAIFAVELFVFLALKDKLTRIYQPRTYLVPDRERMNPAPSGLFRWISPVFQTSDADLIQRSGLDTYFFLRYLRMLLKIFIPLTFLLVPVLVPINRVGGKGTTSYVVESGNVSHYTVTGLDQLAWGNIKPTQTHRYWAHLIMAIIVVVYVCAIFFDELRGYIRMRQAYMTSPQHRLRASATTVLVTAIPTEWLTFDALNNLFDVFPGGVRNIWINRNFDELNEKVKRRRRVALKLESAETSLVRQCKKAYLKQLKAESKKSKKNKKSSPGDHEQELKEANNRASQMAMGPGISSGNPHEAHTLAEVLHRQSKKKKQPIPSNGASHNVFNPAIAAAGAVGQGVGKLGKSFLGGLKKVEGGIDHTFIRTGAFFESSTDNHEHEQPRQMTISGAVTDERPLIAPDTPAMDMNQHQSIESAVEKEKQEPEQQSSEEDEGADEDEYPIAYNEDFEKLQDGQPLWTKYIKAKDRDTYRLPWFKWSQWPTIWLIGRKVDAIDYCRKELARLNLEIELDQQNPEKFPLMNSAFIQFNHQVAAHMACQSVSHHLPKQMAPRIVEISPDDVIWDNMSMKWWERYVRTFTVLTIICGMVIFWAIPVAFTGLLSQLSYLEGFSWLSWLKKLPSWIISAIQGVLPTAFLAILMAILPPILRLLCRKQGVFNGMAVEMTVQNYYFAFLFVQLFLVVTVSSSIASILEGASSLTNWPTLLANDVPKSSNYFFSYMLLRAMSVSAGALMQVASLIKWFILALLDKTARKKWNRATNLIQIKWGSFFPIYTTLAAIGMIYCVVAPLILIFNLITFSAFWFVYRYRTLYVTKCRFDTGGLLFPRAINQLFTGLYTMEIALIFLFFLVRDENDAVSCKGQGIVMCFMLAITIGYQFLLNEAFGPLIRYIPVSLEDAAIRRDEEFKRAQSTRLMSAMDSNHDDDDDHEAKKDQGIPQPDSSEQSPGQDIELKSMEAGGEDETGQPKPVNSRHHSWASRSSKRQSDLSYGYGDHSANSSPTANSMREKIIKDTEGQKYFSHNLTNIFAGINDELEDLTPDERDELVQRAFRHEALRAKQPVIWIPRDDIGVSDDEVYRTQQFSQHIWISNEYQALDEKCKTIYSRRPPDFSDLELIQL